MVFWEVTFLFALSLKACVVAVEQESIKANGYLIDKWGKLFDFNDFSHDGILSIEDTKVFGEHYRVRGDMTDKQIKMFIKDMDRLWKDFYFTNKKELSKDDFINLMKQRYESNTTAFIEMVLLFESGYCKLIDLNGDKFLSKDEFIMDFNTGKLSNTKIDEQFFYMYRPVYDRIPFNDMIMSFVRFYTEPDKLKTDIVLNGLNIGV
ncbi:sarcoplasmic calcium-binding protein-like [Ruditapes philippinarum]|uniref:sarcoplasmic calcium-binding protein-like n=1 Tax=Ruditapes philippinarum TaxID=129788 RepID=UPI00295BD2F3|nr:sarcoplasmic calcium-binding protein-like [Ruditapes philippinarum]